MAIYQDQQDISIKIDSVILEGILTIPVNAVGIVLFVHGSGSGRFSERNQFVANILNKAGIATLLFDLLTLEEDQIYQNRFNIALLAERLILVTKHIQKNLKTNKLKIAYFGASTGAAAALIAATRLGQVIIAIVSRGGRPDLALEFLSKVEAATLLIVGGADQAVIPLNQKAYEALQVTKKLMIIPGATHLFPEPGALEQVAELACEWFQKFFNQSKAVNSIGESYETT